MGNQVIRIIGEKYQLGRLEGSTSAYGTGYNLWND